jgi:hypothetical protein
MTEAGSASQKRGSTTGPADIKMHGSRRKERQGSRAADMAHGCRQLWQDPNYLPGPNHEERCRDARTDWALSGPRVVRKSSVYSQDPNALSDGDRDGSLDDRARDSHFGLRCTRSLGPSLPRRPRGRPSLAPSCRPHPPREHVFMNNARSMTTLLTKLEVDGGCSSGQG